ncbi:MAG: hypothetical protein ACTSVE_11465, partial [Candidatus Helarchaeota archaeon]
MRTEILYVTCSIVMVIALVQFARAGLKIRKTLPILFKILLAFFIITIATLDHAAAYYFYFIGWFTSQTFQIYQFIFEIIMGAVGFYFFFDINIKRRDQNYMFKFISLLIPMLLSEAYFIFIFQNPHIFDGYQLFPDFYHFNLFLLGEKLFFFSGITIFCIFVTYVILKNKIYSLSSKILLSFGVLAFIDILFTFRIIEDLIGELNLIYIFWSLSFAFIIVARLTKINYASISGVHEIFIAYKDGRPLFNVGDVKVEPALLAGIVSAITDVLEEALGTKKKVKSIDHQDKKILFSYG